jgi:TRAP-type mannitol/chloroaromatic compound transport system permease small subunit
MDREDCLVALTSFDFDSCYRGDTQVRIQPTYLLHDAHVAIDILVQRLSARKRAILDLITFLFFFVAVGGLLVETTLVAWSSVQTKEMHYSFWAPPMYPLRVVMAVGVLLLFLEGIAKFISKLLAVIGEKKEGET